MADINIVDRMFKTYGSMLSKFWNANWDKILMALGFGVVFLLFTIFISRKIQNSRFGGW